MPGLAESAVPFAGLTLLRSEARTVFLTPGALFDTAVPLGQAA